MPVPACYASSLNPTLTGVVVLDSADVYGFEWVDSVILNAYNYGFWISDATSFSIMGSTFATWGTVEPAPGQGPQNDDDEPTYDAITVAGARDAASAHLSFIITGNTFYKDPDFWAYPHDKLRPIPVQGGARRYFTKYYVANNLSYGDKVVPSTNEGSATGGSVFENNL